MHTHLTEHDAIYYERSLTAIWSIPCRHLNITAATAFKMLSARKRKKLRNCNVTQPYLQIT